MTVPTRTVPLFLLLLAIGACALLFAFRTVHRETWRQLPTNSMARRTAFTINYWIEHGYFATGGLLVRPDANPSGYAFYLSSSGGNLVSGFVLVKMYRFVTGRPGLRLLALHNAIVALLAAVTIALLAFRLAQRIGASPLHALILAACVELVHFTFPDNLATYWEMTGRPWWMIFAAVFLLIEERFGEDRTRAAAIVQAIVAFFVVYMELVAGVMFLASCLLGASLIGAPRIRLRRAVLTMMVPALLAFGVLGVQRSYVAVAYPDASRSGSSFLSRTGLDGSSLYYGDHLDIAYRRDVARGNFSHNRPYLFRWQWLFFAGVTAFASALIFGALGRLPPIVSRSLLALTGTYVLYASVFSQGVMIHPYYFDVLLFTPLVLTLFCVMPALLESMTAYRGIVVAAVVFVAVWVAFVQLRRFAMWYPAMPA